MRFVFAIVSLGQGGGLQRDCLGIARLVRARGHHVKVLTTRGVPVASDLADGVDIELVECDAWTNHGRNLRFAAALPALTRGLYDRIIGFDKLSHLDVLYCADPSIGFRLQATPLLRLLPRYRALASLERDSFKIEAATQLLLLSERQVIEYRQAWNTPAERLFLVPPTLIMERRQPGYRHDGTRQRVRAALSIDDSSRVWLAICLQPYTKGLDRVIAALARFPQTRLFVVGADRADRRANAVARRAQYLGVGDRISWLGYRTDVPELMAAADLLVHPARQETTGTVILEALINGVPVVTTSVCGYSNHVEAARAGIVVAEPFRESDFDAALAQAEDPARSRQWSQAGIEYGAQDQLYAGWERAADLIIGKGA